MSAAPTPRQLEALRSLFNGRSISDRRDSADPFAKSWSSNTGGAVGRMFERMGDNGWLVEDSLKSGRTFYTSKLSVAGLELLAAHAPDLPGIDEKIAERRALDAEQAAAELVERERARRIISAASAARQRARAASLREIAQKYQVRLDLTDDQCLAMWMEIIEQEHEL